MGNQYQPRRDPPSASPASPTSPATPLRIVRTRPLHERLGQPAAYREPEHCPFLPQPQEQTTARVPTPAEVERLQKAWLRNPTFDIEWLAEDEHVREYLANWHQEQVEMRAQALCCSKLMAAILEELVHCWIECKPPRSPLATRILLSFG